MRLWNNYNDNIRNNQNLTKWTKCNDFIKSIVENNGLPLIWAGDLVLDPVWHQTYLRYHHWNSEQKSWWLGKRQN